MYSNLKLKFVVNLEEQMFKCVARDLRADWLIKKDE